MPQWVMEYFLEVTHEKKHDKGVRRYPGKKENGARIW